MQSLFRKYLPLLFLCISSASVFAQPAADAHFQKIDEENGLSDNQVSVIYKDHRNLLWVGTLSGLNLLDGSTITSFLANPGDKNAISGNYIKCLTEDSAGNILVGTKQGLNFFNPTLRKFSAIALGNSQNSKEEIMAVVVDPQNNFYVSALSGLYFYDSKKAAATPVRLPGRGQEAVLNNRVTGLYLDTAAVLWICTFNDVWSYDTRSKNFVHRISKQNDPAFTGLYTTLIADRHGRFWIGTWTGGLRYFDPVIGKVEAYPLAANSQTIASLDEITGTMGDSLIIMNNQLFTFNIQTKTFSSLVKKPFDATVVYIDADKRIWVGTKTGLYFKSLLTKDVRTKMFGYSITGQGISFLQQGHTVLMGADNANFISAYDENLKASPIVPNAQEAGNISCLSMQAADGPIIKCGTNQGVAEINLRRHSMRIEKLVQNTDTPSLNFITALFKDSHGMWWYFPWRNGIWQQQPGGKLTRIFSGFKTPSGKIKPLVISAACEDDDHNIWMSDYDQGVVFYDRKTNQFSRPFESQLGHSELNQILYYKGVCFSFTGSRLLSWNTRNPTLKVTSFFPLLNKAISSICIDSAAHLWIATRNGLFCYNPQDGGLRRFTTADGLPAEMMEGTLFCNEDGRVYFGCADYVVTFRPDDLLNSYNEKAASIVLTSVVADGREYAFDTGKIQAFGSGKHSLVFNWALPDYRSPLNNQYYYRLEGVNNTWQYAGKSGRIEYPGLSAGDYTLLLAAKNSNGIDAGQIMKLQFAIALPFYKSWWFICLICIGTLFIFYQLYRYRLAQQLKILALRNSISMNLHDEVGSTLSSISILSQIAMARKDAGTREQMLRDISDSSATTMEKMDDIVWAINPRNDSLESLLLRIRAFGSRLFEASDMEYEFIISEQIKTVHLSMKERQNLYLIMKEAINNAVKYAGAQRVVIRVNCDAHTLSVSITDNGKGFLSEKECTGNGLISMRSRAQDIGAILHIASAPGKGSELKLSLNIK